MRTLTLSLALISAAAVALAAPVKAPPLADRANRLPAPPTAPMAATTEADLVAVLKSDAQLKEKIDACREIGRIGTAAAVPALAALLPNPELSHMARVALEMIPDEAAAAALRSALGTTTGALRVGVAGSLGARRDAKSVAALAALLKDSDPALVETSAKALGRIGGAEALQALEGALGSAPAPLRAALGEGLLRCAEAAESPRAASSLYDRLLAAGLPPPVRQAALRGAILARGEDGVPMILDALRGTDGLAISTALRAAHELPGKGVSKKLADALPSLPAVLQPVVVGLLGQRGDADAAPALTGLTKAGGDKALRLAAIGALLRVGAEDAAPLLAGLAGDSDEDIAQAARSALGTIPGAQADKVVLAMLDRDDAAARAAAVELIAQRAPAGACGRLLKVAADPDEKVRVAALRALKSCATADDIPALLARLPKAGPGTEMQAYEGALGAICAREMRKTPARVTIVRAIFGDLPDGKSADVTAKLAELVRGGARSVEATGANFGDPAPGIVKSFAVTYAVGGQEGRRTVREGETVVFPDVATDPACSGALLAALPSAAPQAKLALLRVLGSTGGPKAFEAIRAASAAGDAEIRGVAMRLLCEWPTPLALPVLKDAARNSPDAAIKLLALRGAIRLIPQCDEPPAARLAALSGLGDLVRRVDEQKLVLAALGGIPSPEALALVLKDLDTPALRQEAAAAAVSIGEAIAAAHGEAVSEAMKKAMKASENAAIRRRAKVLIRDTKPETK